MCANIGMSHIGTVATMGQVPIGMKPGSGTGHPVLKLGTQFRNWVYSKITSSPVLALGHPVPALGASFCYGANLGTWVFQCWNWVPVPAWDSAKVGSNIYFYVLLLTLGNLIVQCLDSSQYVHKNTNVKKWSYTVVLWWFLWRGLYSIAIRTECILPVFLLK
jgi:hypothetical protein